MSALAKNHEPVFGIENSPGDGSPRPCQIQKRLWLLTQSSVGSKTKTIGQQDVSASTEAMINELEMGFFLDGPSVYLPENDDAQSLDDVYDGWISTHDKPQQLYEGAFGGDFETLEKDMAHWGELDPERKSSGDHIDTDGLPTLPYSPAG